MVSILVGRDRWIYAIDGFCACHTNNDIIKNGIFNRDPSTVGTDIDRAIWYVAPLETGCLESRMITDTFYHSGIIQVVTYSKFQDIGTRYLPSETRITLNKYYDLAI